MADFTLKQYEKYLRAIKEKFGETLTYREYFIHQKQATLPDRFCLLRHDIDRRLGNAIAMARLEAELGLKASYYCRNRKHLFVPKVLREMESLGHEVGYHYECLSDANGNFEQAYNDFAENLKAFREHVKVDVIAMHGSALKPYDNRDMWKSEEAANRLFNEFKLLGEVYLHIDYSDILYVTDTGRNWVSGRSNKRDKVETNVMRDFDTGEELLSYLQNEPHNKMVFQIHPERWSNSTSGLLLDAGRDGLINLAKRLTR